MQNSYSKDIPRQDSNVSATIPSAAPVETWSPVFGDERDEVLFEVFETVAPVIGRKCGELRDEIEGLRRQVRDLKRRVDELTAIERVRRPRT